ncbi:MotA/TolQ/ExbB proton channel family protein [Cerasicoccus arenae]|uniref:Flagellar motor protein MotA n=1 Tax=Cerasicoccus arenae TaxID=424488 RepID=A0A8J3GCK6_9BACT|nr:MotA/TolQ/ExbB proton channel family protein [Cerasicoccus arenae]MBK1856742.1 MotA/TolQ/ExbB proton channel family protein [Cerasicoccus arenae]GHB99223.1 flagellar motor protein MotA [Cerasicoccus arenae]
MRPWFFLLFLLLAPLFAGADDLAASAKADLKLSLDRLRAERTAIAEEKAVLLQTFNELEASVREKRRQWELLKLTAGQQGADYEQRRRQLAELEQKYGAFQAALVDYRIYLESNLHSIEMADYQKRFGDASAAGDLTAEQARDLVDYGMERLRESLAGRVIPGEAVGPSGELLSGQFLLWGPMAYFSNEWTNESGFVIDEEGLSPHLTPFTNEGEHEQLEHAMAGQPATLPLDASNGRALRLTQEHEDIADHLRSGGVWVWPILTLAVLALAVFIYKVVEIGIVRMPSDAALDSLFKDLSNGRIDAAKEQIARLRDPAKSLLAEALERVGQPREVLEDLMLEHVIRWQMHWERGLAVLAVTAAVSPLLGLLGTVTGMIATFRLIGVYGSGDARPLSGGISEALVTTELGLMVAIPALIVHALLSRKAQSLTSDLENVATRFIDGLPAASTKDSADA